MDNWCEGCEFHAYPYEAQVPISGETNRVYRCDEDIWDVVKLLIAETKETNKTMGKSFDIAASISQQLPFFSCMNIVLRQKHQKDISRYLYCKEFNISPFEGDYGMQPHRWINKVNIMKIAMTKRDERIQRKVQRESEIKAGNPNG